MNSETSSTDFDGAEFRQMYRPDDEHSYREYFDFEPSIDRSVKDYVTNSRLVEGRSPAPAVG